MAAAGWGATTTALRALTAMRILNIMVEVGLVLGVSAATTPMGQAMSYTRFCASWRMTPTVGMSLIDSHKMLEASTFLSVLCSGTP